MKEAGEDGLLATEGTRPCYTALTLSVACTPEAARYMGPGCAPHSLVTLATQFCHTCHTCVTVLSHLTHSLVMAAKAGKTVPCMAPGGVETHARSSMTLLDAYDMQEAFPTMKLCKQPRTQRLDPGDGVRVRALPGPWEQLCNVWTGRQLKLASAAGFMEEASRLEMGIKRPLRMLG